MAKHAAKEIDMRKNTHAFTGSFSRTGFTHSFKNAFLVAIYNFSRWRQDVRYPLLLVIVLVLLFWMLDPLCAFSRDIGYATNPFILPFALSSPINQFTMCVCALLLFADMPYIGSNQLYVIKRCGRRVWVIGQIIYIILAALVFVAILIILSLLVLAPISTLNTEGWGKVVSTLTYTNVINQTGINFDFDPKIVEAMAPICAELLEAAFEFLLITLLGLIIFTVNLLFKVRIGAFVGMCVSLFDLMIVNMLPYILYHISPASMARLSVLDLSNGTSLFYPSPAWACGFFLISIFIISAFSILFAKRLDLINCTER